MLRDLPQPFPSQNHFPDSVLMRGETNAQDADTWTSAPELFDDVFGSAPSSPTRTDDNLSRTTTRVAGPSTSQHPSDIPRLRSTHVTSGYREGVAVSKEKYVQKGFDEGYSLGAELALKAGQCLGILEGLLDGLPSAAGRREGERSAEGMELSQLVDEAESSLKVEKLCGREWFGEDGVWTFDVPGQDDAEETGVSFSEVASAHPIIKHWTDVVQRVATERGIRLP